jgi:hypothetical protein
VLYLYHSVVLRTVNVALSSVFASTFYSSSAGFFLAAPAVFYPLSTLSITLTQLKRLREQILSSLAHPKVNFD